MRKRKRKNYGLPKGATNYEDARQRIHLDSFLKRYRLEETLGRTASMHDSWHGSPFLDAGPATRAEMYLFFKSLREMLRDLYGQA